MNIIQLAELRAWLNRTGRREWRIAANYNPELKGRDAHIIYSPNDAARIYLIRYGKEWQARAVLNPGGVSGGTTLPRVHGTQPRTACQDAIRLAARHIAGQ